MMELKNPKHIYYRRWFFSVSDSILSAEPGEKADIHYYLQSPQNVGNALQDFYTLLIDLQQPEEEIRSGIYHRTLAEINSFISNQHFQHKILFPVPGKELKDFIKRFDSFAEEKKIRKAEVQRLKAYNTAGILAISFIRQNEKVLCINFYRLTQERATNLHSFTVKGNFGSSHLGRAHRTLHWLDILAFKKEKVSAYDFGGWYAGTNDKDLLNINAFKEQFTKHKVKEYTGVIYQNKLLRFLASLLR